MAAEIERLQSKLAEVTGERRLLPHLEVGDGVRRRLTREQKHAMLEEAWSDLVVQQKKLGRPARANDLNVRLPAVWTLVRLVKEFDAGPEDGED